MAEAVGPASAWDRSRMVMSSSAMVIAPLNLIPRGASQANRTAARRPASERATSPGRAALRERERQRAGRVLELGGVAGSLLQRIAAARRVTLVVRALHRRQALQA